MTNSNLYAVLAERFKTMPERIAIEVPATATTASQTWTFGEIDAATARMANWLQSLGLERGSRVLAQVEKSVPALLLYLATLRAGLAYVPLNTAYTAAEMDYFLGDALPGVFVCDPERLSELLPFAQQHKVAHTVTLDANGQGTLMDACADCSQTFETVASGSDDLAAILYTSGTTGRSKGAMLTHANLVSNMQTLDEHWGWHEDDVLLHMLPIFHIHGLFVACHGALHAGARMLWFPKFDVDQALAQLPRATLMMGVPTFYVRLLGRSEFNADIVPNMRLFVSGSAPLLPETFREFERRTGQAILERYGMSETGMQVSNPWRTNESDLRVAGTVGMPLPGIDVRVVDDADQLCEVGDVGHIQVRGPNVFAGYWKMPEKTREEFTADGWFRTGDMGCWGGLGVDGEPVDARYLSIVGRSKDLVITGGYNVYPREVELEIDKLDGVEESAVVGVPHADFGEQVVAVVVAKLGVALDSNAMMAALRDRLANYKVPKEICQVSALPRNAMGKVQKNVIRDGFQSGS